MAMSRILSQSLVRHSLAPPTALFAPHRHRSTKTNRAHLVEIDVDQPDAPEANAEVIAFGIKKLEDAIHSIIVRRAAPDWLPFLPGYSYWVPPRSSPSASFSSDQPASSMMEVIGKLAASGVGRNRSPVADLMSDDEQKAFTSSKGWPSSAFFREGTSPVHPLPMVKLEMKIQDDEEPVKSRSDSEDEE